MKLNHLAATTIVAMFTMWASHATARPASFQFERLNFSLVCIQQGPAYPNPLPNVVTSNNVSGITITNSRIVNKDLLKFLATAFNTSWPAGALLALDNDSGDIFVVDKTGTNPVFNVSIGINDGDTNVVYFRLDSDRTVFNGRTVNKTGDWLQTQTDYGMVAFYLFSEQAGVTNTDLYFGGFDAARSQKHVVNAVMTTAESEMAAVAGDGTFRNTWTVVKGWVTGSGRWMVPVLPPG